jgi:glyoxylase-like metal-dependent hydrolase (beta-lactamase superfamily II)
VRLIDTHHQGRAHVIGAWLVDGVLVDPGPASTVETLLEGLDGDVPRAIAVTHIHLDHSGGTGTLVERWPGVEVYVHERGAPHLADPAKLLASAGRLYGDEMDKLWGDTRPVPRGNLRVLGDEGEAGPLRYAYTPGHASHHVAYLHEASGTAFTGDVAGVRVAGGPVGAPTPPPDIDLDAWEQSIQLLERWDPDAVAPTHFGRYEDVAAHLAALRDYLAEWSVKARELGRERWIDEFRAKFSGAPDAPAVIQAMPPDQQFAGLERYWSKVGA